MKTTNDAPSQFVKDWLPDFKQKYVNFLNTDNPNPPILPDEANDFWKNKWSQRPFSAQYFAEALATFAEAQKQECANAYAKCDWRIMSEYDTILNAPMPEPKTE